jgi:hypothetical protein
MKHIAAVPELYCELFGGAITTIREFINKVESLTGGKNSCFRTDPDKNKFKGDALEILAELFFNNFSSDPSLGLSDYKPVTLDQDFGVDGIGINANGDTTVVQVKYRMNPTDYSIYPSYTDIAKTFTSGVLHFKINPSKEHVVFVVTTSNDVSIRCREVFENKLVVISYPVLQVMLDNNMNFWEKAKEAVFSYVNETKKGAKSG